MINKACYSFWDDCRYKLNGGFRTKKELAITLTLSVELAKKQFDDVELITNSFGKQLLIDHYKIPFTSVKVVLDQFDNVLDPNLWAYIKIYAYSIQDCPFIHIDNDVLLLTPIPENKLKYNLLFQNKEQIEEHKGYVRLLKEAKGFPKINPDILLSSVQFAYNCGVVGVNDLSIIKIWKEYVDEYLFHPKNQIVWGTVNDKHSHNHLFEQWFISALIHNLNYSDKVETLLGDDFMYEANNVFKYCHLWGPTKRENSLMQKVKSRLYRDYPQYKDLFEQPQTHSEIFDDIYRNERWGEGKGSGAGSSPEITFEYRLFLQKFLSDYAIKSIVDLGCGDWQFSKLIDWDSVENYTGLDCVKALIENNNKQFGKENIKFFEHDCISDFSKFHGDLLIIKDVFIHWKNQEIIDFINLLKQTKKFKYILITNQVENDINKDIHTTGDYHSINLNAKPFNFNCEEIFKWKNDKKITYLIKN